MDNTQEHTEQRILSLCPGSLGLERGIKEVLPGLRTVAYVEIEAFIIFNLVMAIEAGLVDRAPIWTDIKTFNGKPFHERVHGIVAGYPCQGESIAGLRRLEEDPRYLWPSIRHIIRTVAPVWCLFENVDAHLKGTFKYVLRDLRDMGYKVEAGVFSAAEVGAPHTRKRLFILACSDIGELRGCLAYPNSKLRSLSKKPIFRKNQATASKDSATMANASSERLQGLQSGFVYRKRERVSGSVAQCSEKERDKLGDSASNYKWDVRNKSRESQKQAGRSGIECSNITWPAGPGCRQYEWEEPRTVKSGMGCTVDGYNFRTDLLRMYGNAVVSQTATKAFIELFKKHCKNF